MDCWQAFDRIFRDAVGFEYGRDTRVRITSDPPEALAQLSDDERDYIRSQINVARQPVHHYVNMADGKRPLAIFFPPIVPETAAEERATFEARQAFIDQLDKAARECLATVAQSPDGDTVRNALQVTFAKLRDLQGWEDVFNRKWHGRECDDTGAVHLLVDLATVAMKAADAVRLLGACKGGRAGAAAEVTARRQQDDPFALVDRRPMGGPSIVRSGGNITIRAGDGGPNSDGGAINIRAGDAGSEGDGGDVIIRGGDAWESAMPECDGMKAEAGQPSLVDLLGRVTRRLTAKPDMLHAFNWDHPETLNECLTIFHPDGTDYQIRRTGGQLDDSSTLPILETVSRLEAWGEKAEEATRSGVEQRSTRLIELERVMDQVMWSAAAEQSSTKGFRQERHDPLIERLQAILEVNLFDRPRISILQSLQDRGCDLLIDWPQQAKFGVQLKSNGDVEQPDFSNKTLAQIQDSRQHGLTRLYLVLAADITGDSNSQKVRGLVSRISSMNDDYVVTVPPERAWNLLFPTPLR